MGGTDTSTALDKKRIHIFRRKLLQWYALHGRDLPWRHTSDPYHILVSEMMLHQTQVARVVEKYYEWLAIYSTFETLAAAPLDEVRQLWRPLGYNFRQERLREIAKLVVDKLDGKLPNQLDELMAFRWNRPLHRWRHSQFRLPPKCTNCRHQCAPTHHTHLRHPRQSHTRRCERKNLAISRKNDPCRQGV